MLTVFLLSSGNYLAGHTKKSLRLRVKHLSDLTAFVELPVELQLLVSTTCKACNIIITHRQVLEHLHPIDLYHFSQVSKYFRRLVLDPAVLAPVWKAAFMRHPDLPTPPPGVKEPEWAFMIYGPGICGVCLCNAAVFHPSLSHVEQVCGKYGALTSFSLQKRFCEPCLVCFGRWPYSSHCLHRISGCSYSSSEGLPWRLE